MRFLALMCFAEATVPDVSSKNRIPNIDANETTMRGVSGGVDSYRSLAVGVVRVFLSREGWVSANTVAPGNREH